MHEEAPARPGFEFSTPRTH